MGVHIREKRKKLYLDIYTGGQRRWEALHLTLGADRATNKETMRLADIIRQRREMSIAAGEHGILDPVAGREPLADYMRGLAVLLKHKAMKRTADLVKEYAPTIRLASIDEKWLDGWKNHLAADKGFKASTSQSYLGLVVQALRRALRDRLIPRLPVVDGIHVPDEMQTVLSIDQVQALAAVPPQTDLEKIVQRAFLFGCLTGLRYSDLRALAWGSIKRDPIRIEFVVQKTSKILMIPLHPAAWELINDKKIHNQDEPVLGLRKLVEGPERDALDAVGRRSGLPFRLTWHTARRSFATAALGSGADLGTVSRLLGHLTLKMSMKYAQSMDPHKRKAVEGIEINLQGAQG